MVAYVTQLLLALGTPPDVARAAAPLARAWRTRPYLRIWRRKAETFTTSREAVLLEGELIVDLRGGLPPGADA